jgi:mono/diheme cytochrome c family protein
MSIRSLKTGLGTLLQVIVGAVVLALLLASCGGGGGNSSDVFTSAPPPAVVAVAGPDSFLLYPNPQSSPAIDSQTYAQAYYTAIDPNNTKDTLTKWKAANGFGMGTGSEVQAVFGDVRDLGYGRYVTARKNTDGTVAFYVDNYLVWTAAGYGYSRMNLDAAVARDQRWYIGTNAIEYSPGPGCTTPLPNNLPECKFFAKYFTFDPTTGARLLAANLDGRGNKAIPGICISCHGGRGDPLTPPQTFGPEIGKQIFAVVGNPASGVRGDVQGKLHFFEPDTFSFSSLSGRTRADQEAAIKTLNKWVLCTYPLPTTALGVTNTNAEDACRSVAKLDEWQGGAADVIKAAYGGDGLPNSIYADNYVPAPWVASGQTTLYENVVKPTCRMCHILRGIGQQSDIDFSTFASFQSSADRIKAHIIDRGNMPLTHILYARYWSTPSTYNTLNAFLQMPDPVSNPSLTYTVADSSGARLLPGRPIADPGPDRTVPIGATTLSASDSLYADSYTWSIASNVTPAANAATLTLTTGVRTTFMATIAGTYVVQLVASKGGIQSDPASLIIVIPNSWPATLLPASGVASLNNPLPADIRFADIKAVLQRTQTGAQTCITCHTPNPPGALLPSPVMYADVDRNGDGQVASAANGTDDLWFYQEVRGRINFSDISASRLLRKPSGYHHNGLIQVGFGDPTNKLHADELPPGDPRRSYYDMFLNWILNGAPY